ncbi:DUF4434 domain-containing protein [Nitrosococcus watsonii]|uniref:DUF4434 domain-containing protein n=1 Tax=Nitrosococcus watsoni (strain C-113) TaxID=105559 RepID=D8KBD7_NITWC|nr:DUF4434 domain-containing protein [Nitrosococcus watsonii]ADJ29584.1 hypothetical protein Nwat_2828 [Nitrosococcus watsonii C-113]
MKNSTLVALFFALLLGTSPFVIAEKNLPIKFTGTFLQLRINQEDWQIQEWAELISNLKKLEISKLIIQWSLYDDVPFYAIDNYQEIKNSPLNTIMELADAAGIKVLVGLAHDSGYWDNIDHDPAWVEVYLRKLLSRSSSVAEELTPLLVKHTSFGGWYITEEIDDINWRGQMARQLIINYLDRLSTYLHTITPNKKVAISCFTNAAIDPDTFKEFWESLLQPTSIDMVLFQDGIGAKKLDFSSLPLYLEAIQEATEISSRELYIITEIFQTISDPDNNFSPFQAVPADFNRIEGQLEIASRYSQNIIAFSIPDYMIPETGTKARRLFEKYINYVNNTKK